MLPCMGFFPHPASPRAILEDIKSFARDRRPHQWFAAAGALTMTFGVLVLFYMDSKDQILPREQIVYIDSWRADRSDAEIKVAQEKRQKEREEAIKARQKMFQDLERKLGM